MLRKPLNYYRPSASDKYHQSTEIIITSDSSTIRTIYYKAGDKFTFKVGKGLTLRRITFEAIDSTIHPDLDTNSCL